MSGSTDTLAAIRRSSQVYYAQVTEQATLSCGVAFTCAQYPNYYAGNQFREVVLPSGRSPAECFEEVQDFYARQGLRCYRWVPASVQPAEPVEALLAGRGYAPNRNLVLRWTREVDIPANPRVRVLPVRAMRKAFRSLLLGNRAYAPELREMLADVAVDRLDDPQYDMFVAMLDDRPAGYGALHQVGEIGRIENVFVAADSRRQGVGRSLMAHLLALSKRLALRITCLETEESNTPAQALYSRCGFEVEGSFVEFVAPEAIREGLVQLSIRQ